jgi:hypothetical protein
MLQLKILFSTSLGVAKIDFSIVGGVMEITF